MSTPQLPVQTFIQEAYEVLENLEDRLLALEEEPTNGEIVDAVFRNLHTLKGSGEMFGFTALARFTHGFENAYDMVRSGKAQVSQALIDLSLRSRDHIQRLIDAGTDPEENARLAEAPEGQALLAEIAAFIGAPAPDAASPAKAAPTAEEPTGATRYRVSMVPDEGSLRLGMRPDLLMDELEALGDATIRCHAHAVPTLEDIDPGACYLAWSAEIETSASRDDLETIFVFADEDSVTIAEVGPAGTAQDGAHGAPEAAADPNASGTAAGPGAAGSAVSFGPDTAPAAGTAPADAAPAPAAAQPAKTPTVEAKARTKKSDSVRVQSDRLDDLMDQLGELVIAQARLNRIARELGDTTLVGTAEEIERLITGLRDATLSIRMLPIGTVFGKFRRVVRDLSSELGKEVELRTEGEDTELDKNVIDSLSEPLVHIIRNSVDHGIEAADVRRSGGKPAVATVTMSARQSGGEVLVSVTDDGGGLKTDAIRERAIERGLIEPGDPLSDSDVNQLIFAPGFSTAKTLSSVSGRGVGMDAVRSVISDLGGSVEVASTTGVGTSITLRLPLTLAIIEGLLVKVSSGFFVLPLANVEECVELSAQQTSRESGRSILTLRDALVPFLDLRVMFGMQDTAEDTDGEVSRRIVIIGNGGRRTGLVVDDIIGQHQTVIKSLSAYHRGIEGLAGGTILGDGSVALILDPVALVEKARSDNAEAA